MEWEVEVEGRLDWTLKTKIKEMEPYIEVHVRKTEAHMSGRLKVKVPTGRVSGSRVCKQQTRHSNKLVTNFNGSGSGWTRT